MIEHGDEQGEGAAEAGVPHVVREHGAFADVVDLPDLGGRDRATHRPSPLRSGVRQDRRS